MRVLHEIAIFQTVKSKVIISLFETVRLSVSISLRNLYNSLNSIKEIHFLQSTQQQQSQQNSEKAPSCGKTPKKQVLAGGTIMEELKVGEGAVAKKGKMVN